MVISSYSNFLFTSPLYTFWTMLKGSEGSWRYPENCWNFVQRENLKIKKALKMVLQSCDVWWNQRYLRNKSFRNFMTYLIIILLMKLTSFIGLSIIIAEIIVNSDKMKNILGTVLEHALKFLYVVLCLTTLHPVGLKIRPVT